MRSFYLWLLIVVLAGPASLESRGGEYVLTNGDRIRGELASFDDAGFAVRLDVGGFSPRISWSKLTQESLKELAKDPRAAKFAEPFIDIPPEQQVKKKKEITVQPVQSRIEPLPKAGVLAAWATPLGLTIVAFLFLANLYAAYAVAHFRNRPVGLVCGVSAVLPIIGPLLFLSFPTEEHYDEGSVAAPETLEGEPAAAVVAQAKKTGPAAPASSLGLASAEKKSGGPMEPTVFKRGDTTFNRRFFETKFSGFFRVVPSEAEKDMVIVIRAGRNEYVAKRISRISSTDLHVQLLNGASEAMVPFSDINEVRVRHKDAK